VLDGVRFLVMSRDFFAFVNFFGVSKILLCLGLKTTELSGCAEMAVLGDEE
jgi:hypothetical protein